MDINVIDKFVQESDARWQERLARMEAKEEGPYDDSPTPECDHKDRWKLLPGTSVVIRFCSGCGKSWRLPVQGDYIFGDHPVAEWEPIREGMEVEQRVLPNYDEDSHD